MAVPACRCTFQARACNQKDQAVMERRPGRGISLASLWARNAASLQPAQQPLIQKGIGGQSSRVRGHSLLENASAQDKALARGVSPVQMSSSTSLMLSLLHLAWFLLLCLIPLLSFHPG